MGWFLRCGARLCRFRQTLRKVSIGNTTPNIGSFSISIALGSCAELETHVEIAHDLKFLTIIAEMNDLLEQLDHESKMLRNLIKRL
jgi:23S rRNA-intervening sequence protein